MTNHSGEIHRNDASPAADWGSLNEVQFAEGTNGRNPGYNEKFINDFGGDNLNTVLKNKEFLARIGNDYLRQYEPNSQSTAKNLAGKESLDHYVLKKLSSDAGFAESQEFKNYSEYIVSIACTKQYNLPNGAHLYPEFYTNPIFSNKRIRRLVLGAARPNLDPARMENDVDRWNSNYQQTIEYLADEVLAKRKKASQLQMDVLGDYLYANRKPSNDIARRYAEYCFNEIEPKDSLKASTPMLGALANYFVNQYNLDENVRSNSRVIIANRMDSGRSVPIGLSTSGYCTLEQNHFLKMSLTTDNSLNKSRTNLDENNDIYRFMMIAFHELTHDHQRTMVERGDKSSSAMMFIMRNILNIGSRCYIGRNPNNTNRKTYYKVNHDSDEIEIQADEEAWRQCRAFLRSHQLHYEHNRDRDTSMRRIRRCRKNEEEVRARRSFTKKMTNAREEVNAVKYDIQMLKATIAENPDLLNTYPQLMDYIDTSGNLRPEIFSDQRLARRSSNGIDWRDDVFGAEIGVYMMMDREEFGKVRKYVEENGSNFSENQILGLRSNLQSILHQALEKHRALEEVNQNNYDETGAYGKYFDITELRTSILEQFLILNYNTVMLLEILRGQHPEKSESIRGEQELYVRYFNEILAGANLPRETAERIAKLYMETKNPALVAIANRIKP